MQISNASKNVVLLTRADLHAEIRDVNFFPKKMGAKDGLTRVVYSDEFDSFEILLQPNSRGEFAASVRLNNEVSYQLNGRVWDKESKIGEIMLAASSAPAGTDIEGFFS